MCGIAGIMLRKGAPPLPADTLDKLTAALAHRGPDGQGRYVHGNVHMAQTRLAVVDLKTGDQPLFAGEGAGNGPALIANGEIYNDPDIRAQMGAAHEGAAQFKTRSDCESPLALFMRHGASFAEHLRGMYAIALHDPASGRLYLARDPFGIKPLYTAKTPYGLAFASEPQAFMAAGLAEPRLRAGADEEVLQAQFISGRECAFEGVTRIAPGETLVCEDGRVADRLRRPVLPSGGPRRESADDSAARLDELMTDTVGAHQRADVSYGMFLSGGIDSAAVLAAMARLNERPVRAFTAGFAGGGADETGLAARMCAATGAEHEIVTVSADDMRRDLPAAVRAMDDPAADYAALPVFALARRAREAGIKVVLTGEGGDEMFAGYGRYRRAVRWRVFGGREMRASGALDGLGILRGSSRAWRRGIESGAAAADAPGRTALQRAQAADIAGWLPNDLLLKLDRCLMAHGVEGRVPFVDPVMAEFAFRLPDKQKTGGGTGKRILRAWLKGALPEAEPWARKQGFTPPVGAWIGEDGARLGALTAANEGVQALCRTSAVKRVFENAGRDAKAGRAAWALLFWALWRRAHIEGAPPGGDIYETLGDAS